MAYNNPTAKHTPGPQVVIEHLGDYPPIQACEKCVGGLHHDGRQYIMLCSFHAAAPDLLGWLAKAAQMAEQQYKGGDDLPMNSSWRWLGENARIAIRKATEGP